jgi:hypothetical protein
MQDFLNKQNRESQAEADDFLSIVTLLGVPNTSICWCNSHEILSHQVAKFKNRLQTQGWESYSKLLAEF